MFMKCSGVTCFISIIFFCSVMYDIFTFCMTGLYFAFYQIEFLASLIL